MITLGFEDPFLEPKKHTILQGQLAPPAGRQGVGSLKDYTTLQLGFKTKGKQNESDGEVR